MASLTATAQLAPAAPVPNDWFEFLSAYHEAVLGWVGGSAKVEGQSASSAAVRDRLALIRPAMDTLFGGRQAFRCCWTHINSAKR